MVAVVSVIIPAFNAAPYIREALESIQAQTLVDWEIVVVDDGSTDATADRVRQAAVHDERITLLQQQNAGEAAARGAGVKHATSDFLYFLDADDVALPDTLRRLVEVLHQHPGAVAAYGGNLRCDATGTPLFPGGRTLSALPRPQGRITEALLAQPLFTIGAVLVRRRALEEQDIQVNTVFAEDWVMWIRLSLKGDIVRVPGKPLMKYRLHRGNQTHRKVDVAEHMKAIEMVYAMPQLVFVGPHKLARLRSQREAYCLFSLGCKELRYGDYAAAAGFFMRSIRVNYWRRPSVWGMYVLARIGWLPGKLRAHLG